MARHETGAPREDEKAVRQSSFASGPRDAEAAEE
jgi:hypothetical protein